MAQGDLSGAALPTLPGLPAVPDDAAPAQRLRAFLAQPAVRRSLPAIAGIGALAGVALLYLMLASGPQRVLYASLSDAERAAVAGALDQGAIAYRIDNATGSITVGEDDLYRARMLVASNAALSAPDTTAQMLDSIPLGSSRTLEGERLRNVRERELMLTIQEIEAVESVRVHLATPERSVFVRENVAPSASVMLRLARGRSLTEDQVRAIVNLVAGSVPGLEPDAVRVVDQQGRLLSAKGSGVAEHFQLQREFEEKLRLQLSALLTPLLGEGNFSSQVQVELDLAEVTSARESYDRDGALRTEAESRATRADAGVAAGVPGVLANTPPPPAVLEEEAPQAEAAAAAPPALTGESSTRRTYELGREVAVSSTRPGGVRRLSVAVALSEEALQKIKPATAEQIRELVSAAMGADPERGDEVTVIAGTFEPVEQAEVPFCEASWFAMAVRYGAAILAVLLGLLLGVRPIIAALRRKDEEQDEPALAAADGLPDNQTDFPAPNPSRDGELLREQVELARRLAVEQPDRAVAALRRMLMAPAAEREA